MQQKKIIITGGGTGGHVYPAIAIADAIKEKQPQTDILFVGAIGKLEMEKIPQAGYKIIGLPITGLQRKLSLSAFNTFINFIKSVQKAKKIIKNFKPNIILGVGGYASAPILYAARKKKNINIFLQEQNSYPGITNRYFAKYAKAIFIAYPKSEMSKWLPEKKIIFTGNPTRKFYNSLPTRQEALKYFGLSENYPVIFLTGGSLGAKTLNQSVLKNIEKIKNENIQLIWQTGKRYYQEIINSLNTNELKNIVIKPFIDKIAYAYLAADLVIARAGAITISELSIMQKPTIFVPSPNVAENHQYKNAMTLAKRNAAIVILDNQAEKSLIDTAIKTIKNKDKLTELSKNIKQFATTQSADLIAKIILNC